MKFITFSSKYLISSVIDSLQKILEDQLRRIFKILHFHFFNIGKDFL